MVAHMWEVFLHGQPHHCTCTNVVCQWQPSCSLVRIVLNYFPHAPCNITAVCKPPGSPTLHVPLGNFHLHICTFSTRLLSPYLIPTPNCINLTVHFKMFTWTCVIKCNIIQGWQLKIETYPIKIYWDVRSYYTRNKEITWWFDWCD